MQDNATCKEFVVKTNAISIIDGENQSLKKLCLQTKGKYVYIDDEAVYEYNGTEEKVTKRNKW